MSDRRLPEVVDGRQMIRLARGPLPIVWLAIPVVSTLLVIATAAGSGIPALATAGAGAAMCLAFLDIRISYLIAVLLASFVAPGGGRLSLQLAVVYGWLAWTFVLTLWRGAWQPWIWPPRPVLVGLSVWMATCLYGALLGWSAGNNSRYLLLEFVGASWPAVALLVCQVQSRRTLAVAGAGLLLISLMHVVFGLFWLKIAQQRLGGVYFTILPGFTAMGLWTIAQLTPSGRLRWFAYVMLVPLLIHQLFSFTRGYWLGALAGLTVATALAWRSSPQAGARRNFARIAALSGAAAVMAATVVVSAMYFGQGDLLASAGRRFESSFSVQSSGDTGSNIMRLAEYSFAIDSARRVPVTGRGFGYLITNRDPFTGRRFPQGVIHNVYIYLWLKLGIIGLAAFAFLMWRFLRGTLAYARKEPDWYARAWGISAVAMTIQALVICLTNYSLIDFGTGIYLAFVWGTVLALQSRGSGADSPVQGGELLTRNV